MPRLKRLNSLTTCLCLFLFIQELVARPSQRTSGILDIKDTSEIDDSLHLNPNEFYPYLLNQELDQAPEGLHISIGGERSFLTGALNPRTKQLLIIDRSKSVVRFARINTLLLKISHSRDDYLNLRTKSNFEEWAKRAEEKGASFTEEDWKFWNEKIRSESNHGKRTAFDVLHKGTSHFAKTQDDFAFKHSNYMHIDSQYEHLKKLADNDKIQAVAVDINDQSSIKALAAAIKEAKVPLSSLDISNVWWDNFTSAENLSFFMKQITLTASKKTKIIASDFQSTGERILNHQIGEDVIYNVWDFHQYKTTEARNPIKSLFRFGRNAKSYKRGIDTYAEPNPPEAPWFRRLCRLILRAN